MGFDLDTAIRDAERCVRRGELREAVLLYERIVAARPADPKSRSRLASVRALLLPSERNALRESQPPMPTVGATAEEEAERLADLGRYGEAAAMYAQVLEQRPESPLALERYNELLALARELHGPAPRPKPSPSAHPERGSQSDPSRRTDRASLLKSLLDRLSRNRR